MPICQVCNGTGQQQKKIELTKLCPHCDGSKVLPDGRDCPHCNEWGEIASGGHKIEKQLCDVCWGSGEVSQQAVMVWFSVRIVPITLLLIGGAVGAWLLWSWLANVILTAMLIIITLIIWGGLTYYFVSQLPQFGEVPPMVWFLLRTIPATLVTWGIGGAVLWIVWNFSNDVQITAIASLAVFIAWGILMFYYISELPE